jgi:hypothetical protein
MEYFERRSLKEVKKKEQLKPVKIYKETVKLV